MNTNINTRVVVKHSDDDYRFYWINAGEVEDKLNAQSPNAAYRVRADMVFTVAAAKRLFDYCGSNVVAIEKGE